MDCDISAGTTPMHGDSQLAESLSLAARREAAQRPQLSTEQAIRAAVLLCFCEALPAQCSCLENLTVREWNRLLSWLDFSGLALYFFDRINELGAASWLPAAVSARLERSLAENAERTDGLIAEARAVEVEFQRKNLSYAVLKGFSLWPHSVPRIELRSQSDLDYLVAEKDAAEAQCVLEARGYHRHAVSGRTWEFKTDDPPARPLTDLYKAHAHRSVELHLEASGDGAPSLLERREMREFHGIRMPALAAVDLFLWQGLHVFKHLSQDIARASHLLEFRRHVQARREDAGFWRQLQARAGDSAKMHLGLGVVTRLIEDAFGCSAPEDLRCWTVDRLPVYLRLCVDTYAYRSILAGFPGNKLCLLLQRELAMAGIPARRTLREQLLPLRFPPAIERAPEVESLPERMLRLHRQLRFLCFRLRFHVVEGIRYLRAAARWRRQKKECAFEFPARMPVSSRTRDAQIP
jgi:hypothetical protein